MRKFNESPDAIKDREDIDSPMFGDEDGITFILFHNFILYSLWPECTHGHLAEYLVDYIKYEVPDPNLIYQDKTGAKRLEKKYEVYHSGQLLPDEIDKIKSLSAGRTDRTPLLERLPQVIQGRVWTESKMISFWNDLVYISAKKNDIIKFINLIGSNPYKYEYEIKDNLYNYEQFMSGKYNDSLEFDPKAVHTLPPDKKGEALKKMGVIPKKPVPLAFKQMIQGESFRSWLEKGEK